MDDNDNAPPRQDHFPAVNKNASSPVGGIETEVFLMSFADRVLVTISQEGRLSHWVDVALSKASNAMTAHLGYDIQPSSALLDLDGKMHAKTLLGTRGDDREMFAHLYATHVAAQIVLRNPQDRRVVTVGVGLSPSCTAALQINLRGDDDATPATSASHVHFDMMELLQKVL